MALLACRNVSTTTLPVTADVKSFETALHKDGKSADFKIYEGAGHAFMNPNNKGGYVPAAAEDAWSRIDHFLAEHLRVKIPSH